MSTWDAVLRNDVDRVLGRPLSETEHQRLVGYLDLLLRWQRVHRLVGSADPRWIVRNIVLDSFIFRRVLPAETVDLLDIGSGAGVPGLLLKLVDPSLRLVMVESRRHRASFLSAAIRELALSEVAVVNERIEAVAASLAGRFDAVVARCAGDVMRFFHIALDLAKPGGSVIATGPPKAYQLPIGEWVTVPGPAGQTRRFAIVKRPVLSRERAAD